MHNIKEDRLLGKWNTSSFTACYHTLNVIEFAKECKKFTVTQDVPTEADVKRDDHLGSHKIRLLTAFMPDDNHDDLEFV